MGPRFESVKAHQWPVGQAAKTAASHAANVGSIPARVTKKPLDKGLRIEYNDLSLRKTVRREKLLKVFFAYFLFQRKVVGVDCGEGPPVPIPNTEVKLTCAENTCLETDRENR